MDEHFCAACDLEAKTPATVHLCKDHAMHALSCPNCGSYKCESLPTETASGQGVSWEIYPKKCHDCGMGWLDVESEYSQMSAMLTRAQAILKDYVDSRPAQKLPMSTKARILYCIITPVMMIALGLLVGGFTNNLPAPYGDYALIVLAIAAFAVYLWRSTGPQPQT